LNTLVSDGKMTIPQRNQLLRDMTDDVASHVLRTNYVQNVLLGNARNLGTSMLGAHDRLMKWLEARGSLNRDLEALPDSDEMRRRAADGEGLTSPEFSVLVAHAKISLRDDLLDSDLPDDPWFDDVLVEYFPPALAEFPEAIKQHPLRREIVATALANTIVNRGGITFVQRAMEEMGATPVQVAHAFMVLREVLGMDEFVRQVEALDSVLSPQTQTVLYLEYRRLMDSCVRHLLGRRHRLDKVQVEVARYRDVVAGIAGSLDELLPTEAVERVRNRSTELESMGIPPELARQTARMSYLVAALEIVDLAELDDLDPVDAAEAYFRIAEGLHFDQLLGMLRGLPQEELWDSAAGSSLRQDLYRLVGSLTSSAMSGNGGNVGERVAEWSSQRAADLDSFNSLVAQLRREKELGLGHAWVLLRDARRLADR
ncbi:MAG: NAD-glutamate dehydrogenase domain-containing protein, partial [Brooklawnia sp.]